MMLKINGIPKGVTPPVKSPTSPSTTAPPSTDGVLTEKAIIEATKGMTAQEEKLFREKMLALSLVLEDEVKELQEQHNKLMNITDKGDLGNTLSKSNIKNMKKKTSEQRQSDVGDETIIVLKGEEAEKMLKRMKEQLEEYKNEVEILKQQNASSNFVKEQNKSRMQMYEESIASTEKMLMEAYQRLHVSANELSLKNKKIIELETKLGLKQIPSKKTIDEVRLKEDLHDREIIQMKTRMAMLEKENMEQKLKIEQLQNELKRTRDESGSDAAAERRARIDKRKKDRADDDKDAEHEDQKEHQPKPAPQEKPPTATATEPGRPKSDSVSKDSSTVPAQKGPKVVKSVLYKQGTPRRINKKEEVFVSFAMNVLLLDASLDGDLDLVKLCVKNGANVNQPNEEGLTPLHSAACNGHAKIVSFLLENGAKVNVTDDDLWTPLHGAACFGEVAVVRDLVQHGANIVATNTENDMPIDIAVEEKTKKYLKEMMDSRKKAAQLYALYDFEVEEPDELAFSAGTILTILTPESQREDEWWTAQNSKGKKGFIPANYVGLYPSKF